LFAGEPAGEPLVLAGVAPLEIGAVQLGWFGVTAAVGLAAAHTAFDEAAGQDVVALGEELNEPLAGSLDALLVAGLTGASTFSYLALYTV